MHRCQRHCSFVLILLAIGIANVSVAALAEQNQPPKAEQKQAQDKGQEPVRKIKSRVQPVFPALARTLNMTGVVKVLATVAPDGRVKEARIVGGHPVFTEAAANAVRQWRYEPARETTTELIEIRFSRPDQ